MEICTICDLSINRTRTYIHTYLCILHNLFNIIFLAVYNLRYSHQGLSYLDKGDKKLPHMKLKFGTAIPDVSFELNNVYAQY